jgi:hypothetical protein
LGYLNSHQRIVAGVVIRLATEDFYSYFLFPQYSIGILQRSIPYIKEEVAQTLGFLELRTSRHALQQFT